MQTDRQINPLLSHVIVLAPVVIGPQRQILRQLLTDSHAGPVQVALWRIAFQRKRIARQAVQGDGHVLLIGLEPRSCAISPNTCVEGVTLTLACRPAPRRRDLRVWSSNVRAVERVLCSE